ncbi:MAG: hypothetical protein ABH836_00105 [Candidatus Omnitrophota bacterium]
MYRKVLFIFLILTLALPLSGCAGLSGTLKDKFVRKKKEEDVAQKFIRTEEAGYPNEVKYKMHFVYWDAWMTELVNHLGENRKKDMGNCMRALEDMRKMEELLKEEKAKELEVYVSELTQIKEDVVNGKVTSDIDKKIAKRELNNLWMDTKREFALYKLGKEWIKPDTN